MNGHSLLQLGGERTQCHGDTRSSLSCLKGASVAGLPKVAAHSKRLDLCHHCPSWCLPTQLVGLLRGRLKLFNRQLSNTGILTCGNGFLKELVAFVGLSEPQ